MKTLFRIDGNSPKMLLDSTLYEADTLLLDLADSVPAENKDEARYLVAEALPFYDFSHNTVAVRLNSLSSGFCEEDIRVITAKKPWAYVLPDADIESVKAVDALISAAEEMYGISAGTIKLIPVFSSEKAVSHAEDILLSSDRICAAMFDAETCSGSDKAGSEMIAFRSRVAVACKVKGISSIDAAPAAMKGDALTSWLQMSAALDFSAAFAKQGYQLAAINEIFR